VFRPETDFAVYCKKAGIFVLRSIEDDGARLREENRLRVKSKGNALFSLSVLYSDSGGSTALLVPNFTTSFPVPTKIATSCTEG
jgi:hypothetical protein